MNDRFQESHGNPYSPLMVVLLLLVVGAATQLDLHALALNW
jgi:hypothetical protein